MFLRTDTFHDRRDAGSRLAAALERFKDDKPVILALPRGGVPVAFEVARALDAELDLLLVRKIGAPGHQELAIGAVVDGKNPQLVLNHEIIAHAAPPPGYIEAEQKRQLTEIERRRQLYRGDEPPPDLKGRTVIVIDDGIATGASMKAALRGVRQNEPQRLILAVPVAPPDTLQDLAKKCDEIVCLFAPEWFNAVGSHYVDFSQTTDEEVVALLAEAKAQRRSD
ncbi:phosphoribosyltransferase [Dongia deserti]|uniref:phosphoribosyltransferase n=1 Tax=Dongia deserti TaxID=2268030 RepID=UPI000E652AEF|nr:phosphoribosyltransferase [Dongia deserti]